MSGLSALLDQLSNCLSRLKVKLRNPAIYQGDYLPDGNRSRRKDDKKVVVAAGRKSRGAGGADKHNSHNRALLLQPLDYLLKGDICCDARGEWEHSASLICSSGYFFI